MLVMFITVAAVIVIIVGIVLGVPAMQYLKKAGAPDITGREMLEAEACFHVHALWPLVIICVGILLLVVK